MSKNGGERGNISGSSVPREHPIGNPGVAKEYTSCNNVTTESTIADDAFVSGGGGGPASEGTYAPLASFSEEQARFAQSVLDEDIKGSKRRLECVQTTIILAWYYVSSFVLFICFFVCHLLV